MAIFDGMDFAGPVGIDGLPHQPGVYLVCTDASGGIKILGAYDADDMAASSAANPKRACWAKNKKDSEPYAFHIRVDSPSKREDIVRGIAERRFYKLDCYDPPRDDF